MQLIKTSNWFYTRKGEPRGYIQPRRLRELWFHTGTACNLSCPFCLEGSKPGDRRLQLLKLSDAKPFIDEACSLGVEQFSFTGGEPFVAREFVEILKYASAERPCLVLTNATDPLLQRMADLKPLVHSAQPVSFRVSLDSPDAVQHEAGRGPGTFRKALRGLKQLQEMGFNISVARLAAPDEDVQSVNAQYERVFQNVGLPPDLRIIAFPDFAIPYADIATPEITEECMTRYQTEEDRQGYMCSFSKMVVKQDDEMRIYACTLVDDDPGYSVAGSLRDSLEQRVMLKHHRCYSCFAYGASCSEV